MPFYISAVGASDRCFFCGEQNALVPYDAAQRCQDADACAYRQVEIGVTLNRLLRYPAPVAT